MQTVMLHLIGAGTNPAHDAGALATVDPQTGALTVPASLWHLVLHGYVPDPRPTGEVDVRQAVAEQWPRVEWERTAGGWVVWCRGRAQGRRVSGERVPAGVLGRGPAGVRVSAKEARRLTKSAVKGRKQRGR